MFYFLALILFLSGCGPGQALGTTLTLLPTQIFTTTKTNTSTVTITPTKTPTPFPSPTKQGGSSGIIFIGNIPTFNLKGNSNIFYINPDGSGLRPITKDGILGRIVWIEGISPNGTQILAISCPSSNTNCHIYNINLDGSSIKRIDNNSSNTNESEWVGDNIIAYIANDQINFADNNGTNITIGKWIPQFGNFPSSIIGTIFDRVIFLEAKHLGNGYSSVNYWWMKSDGSGEYGLLPRPVDPELFTEIKISPDGKNIIWEDCDNWEKMKVPPNYPGSIPTSGFMTVCYGGKFRRLSIASTEIKDDNIIINKERLKIYKTNMGSLYRSVFYEWSQDSNNVLISFMNDTTEYSKTPNPYSRVKQSFTYSYYLWSIINNSEIKLPLSITTPWLRFPVGTTISPDGKQVIIQDFDDYLSILDIPTMEYSEKIGCLLNIKCTHKPNVDQNFTYKNYGYYWLPDVENK
jgi:hypothetical protein